MQQQWFRVSRRSPCPICKKPDWCMINKDGNAVICPRVESDKRAGEAGWLHVLGSQATTSHTVYQRIAGPPPPTKDLGPLARKWQDKIRPDQIHRLALELKVQPQSLCRLSVGWDGEAFTFPMQDLSGKTVGIRRRLLNGRKLSVAGGHEGLFVPQQTSTEGRLLVCEGPTDTASILDTGLPVVGRPNCSTGRNLIRQYARRRDVVIVADPDEPGRKGAEDLANCLLMDRRIVKIVYPITGEDVRDWHPSREMLEATINNARPWGLRKG